MAGPSLDDPDRCPSDTTLQHLLDGKMAMATLDEHLSHCGACQARLEALAGEAPLQGLVPEAHPVTSAALETAIRSLKENPLTHPTDLRSWLASVGVVPQEGTLGELDGYVLRRVIGEGGMGMVLEALDTRLDRVVAIKIIRPDLVGGVSVRQRLLREAQTAARLQHDRIVPIYAVEMTAVGKAPFIVMPYVAGGTLQDLIDHQAGPLAFDQCVAIGTQISEALVAAHEAGLVHRDVKPANVLLRGNGDIWMADFGVARVLDRAPRANAEEVSGTPSFMAPEQLAGEPGDHRGDLFSLGAVLYLMATGEPAFTTDTRHTHEPLSQAQPSLASSFHQLVEQLLDKDPSKRPSSAAAVQTRLRSLTLRKRSAWPVRIFVGLIMLAIAGVFWWQHASWRRAPFRIPMIATGYHSFLEALADAPSGAVIECQQSGVIYHGFVPPIEKPLTLRAINGARPRLEGIHGLEPLLEARAPLILEGLELVVDGSDAKGTRDSPPLIMASAPLQASHCLFARRQVTEEEGPFTAALILLKDAGEVHFSNALFVNPTGTAVAFGGEQHTLSFDNCFSASRTTLTPRVPAPSHVAITATRSTFHARELMLWRDPDSLGSAAIDLSQCIIATEAAVFALPGHRRLTSIREKLEVRDRENLYHQHTVSFLTFLPPRRLTRTPLPRPLRVETLAEWNRLWNLADNRSTTGNVPLPLKVTETLFRNPATVSTRDLSFSSAPDKGISPQNLGPANFHAGP